jgi:hypothetical protein
VASERDHKHRPSRVRCRRGARFELRSEGFDPEPTDRLEVLCIAREQGHLMIESSRGDEGVSSR